MPVVPVPVSAATTLAILLGAQAWPKLPQLASGESFANSARDLKQYLLTGFALQPDNILDYFDSDKTASEIDEGIEQFLRTRAAVLKEANTPARDVLVYYVGHGGFAPPDDDYFLALKATRKGAEAATGLRMAVLAHRLREDARFLRRYVILDCCFSAKAYEEFQAAPLEVAVQKTLESLPIKGTALLCSSGPREPSKAPKGAQHTMFSGALLDVLSTGVMAAGTSMTLQAVGKAIVQHLKATYDDSAVRPEVHSPDQRDGDVATVPVFPNPAESELARQRRADEVAAKADEAFARGAANEAERLWKEVLAEYPSHADALIGLSNIADERRFLEIERQRKQRVLLRFRTTRALEGTAWVEANALLEQPLSSLSDQDRAVLVLVEDLIAGLIPPDKYVRLRALLTDGTLPVLSVPVITPTSTPVTGDDAPPDSSLSLTTKPQQDVARDSDEAVRWYRKVAVEGHAGAQYTLGVRYARGEGVKKDAAEAVRWFQKAAEQGHADAQYKLGVMHARGEGVAKDVVEAVRCYRLAADKGNAKAQFGLGIAYALGEGVPKDSVEAVRWYRKAADLGHANAQYHLGVCYINGDGIAKDAAEAVRWYRKAADQELAAAQYHLGVCYRIGDGVAKDASEALRFYLKAAEQGNADAQRTLGAMYARGEGVPKDASEAVRWYKKAADQGHVE